MQRYSIHPGMTFTEMVIGRKVTDNGEGAGFGSLPFAGNTEGWVAPGEGFAWVLFADGSYWLWSEGQHYGLIAL